MLTNQDFTHDRTKYLGGSDIGAILGVSKFRTPLQVWQEKTGKTNTSLDSLPLRFGNFAEEFVASEYAKATGHSLTHPQEPITHPEHPFLQGHIDRLVFTKDHSDGATPSHLLECKTANPFSRGEWGDPGSDEVPMSYLAQCHWYLALSNLDHCDLAVLFGNSDFRIYQIERDCEVQNLLIEQAVHFWENHVLADIPPDPKTTGDLQSLFQTEVAGKTICADAHTAKLVMQFHQITQEIDVKELEVTRIKQQIMTQMGEAEKLIYQDQILATWKKPKASMRFDSKRFEQEHPELYPLYQAPIANSRRLVIKDCQYNF